MGILSLAAGAGRFSEAIRKNVGPRSIEDNKLQIVFAQRTKAVHVIPSGLGAFRHAETATGRERLFLALETKRETNWNRTRPRCSTLKKGVQSRRSWCGLRTVSGRGNDSDRAEKGFDMKERRFCLSFFFA